MNRIAVYGTLKRGWGNNVLISRDESSRFLGEDVLDPGKFNMYCYGGFPAIVKQEEGLPHTPIHIEVFEVNHEVFQDCDALEGHPRWYCRELVETKYGPAWIYVMPKKNISSTMWIIPDGLWERNIESKRPGIGKIVNG